MVETIGKRIAFLRQRNGLTQQSLADRLAMSRVAISHIEMELTIPSERSITLMAGVFKLSPIELVNGTTYPKAKTERLPEVTNLYTELELQLALLVNDSEWLRRLDEPGQKSRCLQIILEKWRPKLAGWDLGYMGEREKNIVSKMSRVLDEIRSP